MLRLLDAIEKALLVRTTQITVFITTLLNIKLFVLLLFRIFNRTN